MEIEIAIAKKKKKKKIYSSMENNHNRPHNRKSNSLAYRRGKFTIAGSFRVSLVIKSSGGSKGCYIMVCSTMVNV